MDVSGPFEKLSFLQTKESCNELLSSKGPGISEEMFENVDKQLTDGVIAILLAYRDWSKAFTTLFKSVYQKTNFLISQPKHMLWVLKRNISMRRFF